VVDTVTVRPPAPPTVPFCPNVFSEANPVGAVSAAAGPAVNTGPATLAAAVTRPSLANERLSMSMSSSWARGRTAAGPVDVRKLGGARDGPDGRTLEPAGSSLPN
jgi:hypothetical protein